MKHSFSSVLPLKVLLSVGAALLTISASILLGLLDDTVFKYAADDRLATKIVYTTGGFGFIILVFAGMYYFQYRYRL
ncbi:MAG: hypothetical protein ACE5KA_03845 [Nitrososphaerales archaeon]